MARLPRTSASLRNAWRAASLRTGWRSTRDWWTPDVDAVVETVLRGADPAPACAQLGDARAQAGVGLREALDDLCALYKLLSPGGPPLSAVLALAEAWAEAGLATASTVTCEDPLSGLVSTAYLRTRLAEVYREAERTGEPAGVRCALVVVEVDGSVPDGTPDAAWEWLIHRLTLGECLRGPFCGGETFAALSAVTTVGLVGRDGGLPVLVDRLRDELVAFAGDVGPRAWIEELPDELPVAYEMLAVLAR